MRPGRPMAGGGRGGAAWVWRALPAPSEPEQRSELRARFPSPLSSPLPAGPPLARPRPALLRSLQPSRSALTCRCEHSIPVAAPRRWPPRSTKRLAGRRTTWCATTARPSSGEELSFALHAPLPELARGLVH